MCLCPARGLSVLTPRDVKCSEMEASPFPYYFFHIYTAICHPVDCLEKGEVKDGSAEEKEGNEKEQGEKEEVI